MPDTVEEEVEKKEEDPRPKLLQGTLLFCACSLSLVAKRCGIALVFV